jgi:hypothetical protein
MYLDVHSIAWIHFSNLDVFARSLRAIAIPEQTPVVMAE